MKQLLKLSNQLVDTQFSEISSIIGKLETDSHHSYFVHLLLAQSYLNKYQTGLLSKSINNSQIENENVQNSNLQKAVIACRRLARIEDFGLPESFKQNISRSTLANQIMMAVCSNSFYYKVVFLKCCIQGKIRHFRVEKRDFRSFSSQNMSFQVILGLKR